MPKETKTHICNHNINDLFNLVADVESYPEFLPWCSAARIRKKNADFIVADLVICFKGITETYSSHVNLLKNQEEPEIIVKAIDGPFENLDNFWKFKKISENQTEITFEIDFTFKSKILNSLIGSFFKKAYEKMINAFEERANEIYGAGK